MRKPTPQELEEHRVEVAVRASMLPVEFEINAPNRTNTAVCIPAGDGRLDLTCARGLMECIPLFGGFMDMPGCSHVALARNRLIGNFMSSHFEWCMMIDTDIGFTVKDFAYMMEGKDLAVNGIYARKDDSGEVIDKGLGFTRVHRGVFETLAKTLCMTLDFHGNKITDFFPSGSLGNEYWMGEDTAFWLLCLEIGVVPRRETRVRLRHAGRSEFVVNELE